METNLHIQEFLNSENPNKDVIISAYVARDDFYNLESRETREKHIKKLGYTLDQINDYRSRKQDNYVKNYFDKMYQKYQSGDVNIQINFDPVINQFQNSNEYKIIENQIGKKLERFNILSNLLDSSNEQFYQALTVEELMYLGW